MLLLLLLMRDQRCGASLLHAIASMARLLLSTFLYQRVVGKTTTDGRANVLYTMLLASIAGKVPALANVSAETNNNGRSRQLLITDATTPVMGILPSSVFYVCTASQVWLASTCPRALDTCLAKAMK